MIGITADGYNWDFIIQNIQKFMGNGMIWYILPVLVIVILCFNNKQIRVIGFYPYLMFACTICNPVLISIVGKRLGLSDRYYRFFWILPLGMMMGCLCAICVDKVKSRIGKGVVIAVVLIIVIAFGVPVYNGETSPSYKLRENDYFASDTVIDISKAIHKYDYNEMVVLYPDEIMYDICQYDANANSYLDREESWAIISDASEDVLDWIVGERNYERIVKYIYVSGRIDKVPVELMKESFDNTGIDFLVLSQTNEALVEYYKNVGCEIIDNCNGYDVLHYCVE